MAGVRHPETDQPLAGGAVWTYQAGTTTPVNLFIGDEGDEGGFATNPFFLDAAGRAKVFGNGTYKFVIRDSADSEGEILFEIDNAEYVPELAEAGIGPLNADLDFNFNKGVNVAAGSVAGDIVEYQQFTNAVTDLSGDIADVQTNLDNATFTNIGETPDSFVGHSHKLVRVNTGATALEFIPIADIDPDKAFTDLTDTPSNYTGAAGKTLRVNGSGTGVEFTDDPAIEKAFTDLTDTPSDYTGQANKYVRVKALENGLEFVAAPTGDVPIGSVLMYAGAGAVPSGWLECAGQSLLAASYPDLADVLGVSWGAADGVGEVRLPDFRGLFPIGAGTNNKAVTGIEDSKGAAYNGGAVGQYSEDTMQGHDHNTGSALYGGGGVGWPGGSSGAVTTTRGVINDIAGLHGTARQSHMTKPASAAIRFIIRVL